MPVKDNPEITGFFKEVWENTSINEVVRAVLANQALWEADLNKINGLEEKLTEEINLLLEQERSQ